MARAISLSANPSIAQLLKSLTASRGKIRIPLRALLDAERVLVIVDLTGRSAIGRRFLSAVRTASPAPASPRVDRRSD
jgi:hypothetical protein